MEDVEDVPELIFLPMEDRSPPTSRDASPARPETLEAHRSAWLGNYGTMEAGQSSLQQHTLRQWKQSPAYKGWASARAGPDHSVLVRGAEGSGLLARCLEVAGALVLVLGGCGCVLLPQHNGALARRPVLWLDTGLFGLVACCGLVWPLSLWSLRVAALGPGSPTAATSRLWYSPAPGLEPSALELMLLRWVGLFAGCVAVMTAAAASTEAPMDAKAHLGMLSGYVAAALVVGSHMASGSQPTYFCVAALMLFVVMSAASGVALISSLMMH